jgi:nitroreductase
MVYTHADAGFISQNVYLYCASQGLGTVVMGNIDRDAYAKALNLGSDLYITYTQPVGYQR